jgi:hypothetical protein
MIYLPPKLTEQEAREWALSLCRSGLESPGIKPSEFSPHCIASLGDAKFVVTVSVASKPGWTICWCPTDQEISDYRITAGSLFLKREGTS